jgi:hypothetical protein
MILPPPDFKDPSLAGYLDAFIEQAKKHNVRLVSLDALNIVFGPVSNACVDTTPILMKSPLYRTVGSHYLNLQKRV